MCHQCQSNPVYEFTNKRKLCKTCYVKWFEKKFFYTLRKFSMFKRGDKIFILQDKGFRAEVLNYLMKMYSQRGIVSIVNSKLKSNKIAISNTTDREAYEIANAIISKKLNFKKKITSKEAKPLCLFLDREVLLYAKLKKIKFKKEKVKKSKTSAFIDELEKTHPEIKQAIFQGWMKIGG